MLVPLGIAVTLVVLTAALTTAGVIEHNGPAYRVLGVIALSVLGLTMPTGAVVYLLGGRRVPR